MIDEGLEVMIWKYGRDCANGREAWVQRSRTAGFDLQFLRPRIGVGAVLAFISRLPGSLKSQRTVAADCQHFSRVRSNFHLIARVDTTVANCA